LRAIENYWDLCERDIGFVLRIVIHTVEVWDNERLHRLRDQNQCVNDLTGEVQLSIHFEYFDASVKLDLAGKHRRTMARFVTDFDLFIYQEDDMMVTAESVQLFLYYTSQIESHAQQANLTAVQIPIVGFTRYEILDQTTIKDTIEPHPANRRFVSEAPVPTYTLSCLNNVPYFVDNISPHQAMFMLTKTQVLRLQNSCQFLNQDYTKLPHSRSKRIYMSTFSVSRFRYFSVYT
jgi:hypothetical protein